MARLTAAAHGVQEPVQTDGRGDSRHRLGRASSSAADRPRALHCSLGLATANKSETSTLQSTCQISRSASREWKEKPFHKSFQF